VAKLTAIRVLAALGTPEAKKLLWDCLRVRDMDAAIAAHARRALSGREAELPAAERERLDATVNTVLNASQKDDRIRALHALGEGGYVEAIPAMRASFFGDISGDVREAAALALAKVGDVESVDAFVRMLRGRAENPSEAKIGAYALGILGDVRGIDELLRAYAEGWQPGILAEAMRQVGAAALEPIVSLLEARPEILERKAALGVVAALPEDDVVALLVQRLNAMCGSPDFCQRAGIYVKLAGGLPGAAKRVAGRVIELRPHILDKKKSSSEERALAKACAKFVDSPSAESA
jgi:HEAT repeat protein